MWELPCGSSTVEETFSDNLPRMKWAPSRGGEQAGAGAGWGWCPPGKLWEPGIGAYVPQVPEAS